MTFAFNAIHLDLYPNTKLALELRYVDLYTFRVVGLGLGNVDLSNFWGQSVAEVVAYSVSHDGPHSEPKKSYLFRFCIENFPDSPILQEGKREEDEEDVSSDEENEEEASTSQHQLQVKAWIQTYSSSRKIEDRYLIVSANKDTLRTWKSCVKIFKSLKSFPTVALTKSRRLRVRHLRV